MSVRVNWIGFKTLVRKEIIRVARIWVQTIVPPAITMTLYFIIFGNLIGRRIGVMDGFDYMQYIAPGLIMMSVITNSYSNCYRISNYSSGKCRFDCHTDEAQAIEAATRLARKLSERQHVAANMTNSEAAGYAAAVQSLVNTTEELKAEGK